MHRMVVVSTSQGLYGSLLTRQREREFFMDNLLVRVHRCFWCTGLAPWEFESPFPGSLISTFLGTRHPCVQFLSGDGRGDFVRERPLLQGYLAHKKPPHPGTLQ